MRTREASDPLSLRLTSALLLLCAVLICLRMPQVVISGRFWGEEGRDFFHSAWVLPPAQALFVSFAGYLNLGANAATLAARWLMPLPLAPYLTITFALFVQLFPALLILSAKDTWLRPLGVKLVGVLLILLVLDAEEVWLHTLHCQFELALCCGIILTLDLQSGFGRVFRLGVLFLAPLCGPVVIVLLPLFLLRAALDRSSERLLQAAVLGFAAAIQLMFFLHLVVGRGNAINPVTLLCVVTIRHIELPFLGVSHANSVSQEMRAYRIAGHIPSQALYLPALVLLPFTLATLRRPRFGPAAWFLASATLIAGISYFGAIGGLEALFTDVRGGGRYFFVPQALLSLALFALAATGRGWLTRLSWAGVVWLLVIGAHEYTQPFSVFSNGPAWRAQVAAWRTDPKHVLLLWPAGWSMTLDRIDR